MDGARHDRSAGMRFMQISRLADRRALATARCLASCYPPACAPETSGVGCCTRRERPPDASAPTSGRDSGHARKGLLIAPVARPELSGRGVFAAARDIHTTTLSRVIATLAVEPSTASPAITADAPVCNCQRRGYWSNRPRNSRMACPCPTGLDPFVAASAKSTGGQTFRISETPVGYSRKRSPVSVLIARLPMRTNCLCPSRSLPMPCAQPRSGLLDGQDRDRRESRRGLAGARDLWLR
jgi:hypothetical protein